MSPLFMDTGYEPNSPGSLSAEECHSNTAGSEREGDGPQTGRRGTKRREKNRDAARKSRKKQTERADELHEELQCLERSNSALQKEIAALKKDFQRYTTALSRHEPYCLLRAASASSTSPTCLSTDRRTGSSSPRVPPPASNSILSPSPSTSLTSGMGLQTLDCAERTRLSPSAPAATTTTLASSAGLTAELFPASSPSSSSSSPVTSPYSVSFSTHTAPHSLFCDNPPVTSRPANVKPASASLLSDYVPLTQSGQDAIVAASSVLNPSFTVDSFLAKQDSFLTDSPPNALPCYSHLQTENRVGVQAGPINLPQLHPCQFSRNPNSLPYKLPPKYNQVTPSTASLLSLLTVPSPLNVSQTTSSTSRSLSQPPPPPLLADPSKDLSLSELLEINDWILGGNPTE